MCLAFKGDLDSVLLRFYVKYTDKSGVLRYMYVDYRTDSYSKTQWNHMCINFYDYASNYDNLIGQKQPGSLIYVRNIYISQGLLIDDIWIGRVPMKGTSPFPLP